jgi:hypothetical protein
MLSRSNVGGPLDTGGRLSGGGSAGMAWFLKVWRDQSIRKRNVLETN